MASTDDGPKFEPPDTHSHPKLSSNTGRLLSQYLGWDGLSRLPADEIHKLLTVVGTLGLGSVGLVEKVKGPSPKRPPFARKQVFLTQRPQRSKDKELEIVKDEAKVIEDLVHTHIVHIFGTYEHTPETGRPSFSLLMFPVGDGDLEQLLHDIPRGQDNKEANKRDWLVRWFYCLTSALEYVHSQGVRHEDIKPSNIIHKDDHVFFTDFSSSSRFNPGGTTSTETPARASAMYSAPEVLEKWNERHEYNRHGTTSDIFSLGCVFMEMLAVIGYSDPRALRNHLKAEKWHFWPQIIGGSPPAGAGFCYGYSTTGADTFFKKFWEGAKEKTNPMRKGDVYFNKVIAPMLQSDRKKRPSATEIIATMKDTASEISFCRCTNSYLPDENIARRPSYYTDVSNLGRIFDVEMRSSLKDFYSDDMIHPGEHVAVLWEYSPRHEDEFDLKGGELIQVLGLWEDGWGSGIKQVLEVEQYLDNPDEVNKSHAQPDKTQIGAFPLVCACLPQHWRKARHEKMEQMMMELVDKRKT